MVLRSKRQALPRQSTSRQSQVHIIASPLASSASYPAIGRREGALGSNGGQQEGSWEGLTAAILSSGIQCARFVAGVVVREASGRDLRVGNSQGGGARRFDGYQEEKKRAMVGKVEVEELEGGDV